MPLQSDFPVVLDACVLAPPKVCDLFCALQNRLGSICRNGPPTFWTKYGGLKPRNYGLHFHLNWLRIGEFKLNQLSRKAMLLGMNIS